jgi:two-component system, LytTR family, response regulator AlgR
MSDEARDETGRRGAAGSAAAPLRVLLVDDEELARLRLRGLVGECGEPKAAVVGEAANAAQAMVWLATQSCDLLLLDVQMPGPDGTQLAADLRQRADPPAVVFVTAHAQHALRAFDLDAIDYLTKPVRRERLQAALQRVAHRLALQRSATLVAPPAASAEEPPAIVVTDRGRVVRVPLSEVLYFKAELKYVTLRTTDHTYVLDDALSELEQRLGERFLRVHRNALVARKAVRALERRVAPGDGDEEGGEGWAVRMAAVDEWLAVSRRQVAAVREALVAAGR